MFDSAAGLDAASADAVADGGGGGAGCGEPLDAAALAGLLLREAARLARCAWRDTPLASCVPLSNAPCELEWDELALAGDDRAVVYESTRTSELAVRAPLGGELVCVADASVHEAPSAASPSRERLSVGEAVLACAKCGLWVQVAEVGARGRVRGWVSAVACGPMGDPYLALAPSASYAGHVARSRRGRPAPGASAPAPAPVATPPPAPAEGRGAPAPAAETRLVVGVVYGQGGLRWSGRPGDLVGARVAVLWSGNKWFEGIVSECSDVDVKQQHHVQYLDGDSRWYRMGEKTFRVLALPPPPSAPAAPPPPARQAPPPAQQDDGGDGAPDGGELQVRAHDDMHSRMRARCGDMSNAAAARPAGGADGGAAARRVLRGRARGG